MGTLTKIVDENGQMVLRQEKWMTEIMQSTYNDMIVIAIVDRGGLEGKWEQAIANRLKVLWTHPFNSLPIKELLDETGVEGVTAHAFDKAAELIFNSKKLEK